MENQTRWIAKWIDRMGNEREFTFSGPSSRAIAGVDFKLECIAAGEPVPAQFELEEGTMVLPTLPKPGLMKASLSHRPIQVAHFPSVIGAEGSSSS